MTIRVLSFDFDGSLCHMKYIFSYDKDVVKHNQGLIKVIKEENVQQHYSKCKVFIGSTRQSHAVDTFNAIRNKRGSCFLPTQKFAAAIGAEFDPFLLADIYGDCPSGWSYHQAVNFPRNDTHSHWRYDESKVTILYAQMHKIAGENPDEDIIFDFYDDRGNGKQADILEHLKDYFTQHEHLLPPRLTLRLHHYNGGAITTVAILKGTTGKLDTNYHHTIQDMTKAAMAAQMVPESNWGLELNVAKYVRPNDLKNAWEIKADTKNSLSRSNPFGVFQFKKPADNTPQPLSQKAIADFEAQLQLIYSKHQDLIAAGQSTAAEHALALHTTLKREFEYLRQNPTAAKNFQTNCKAAIKRAQEGLDTYGGWYEFLVNLVCIISVVGLLFKEARNWFEGRPLFFVPKNQTQQMLQAVEESVTSLCLDN